MNITRRLALGALCAASLAGCGTAAAHARPAAAIVPAPVATPAPASLCPAPTVQPDGTHTFTVGCPGLFAAR